MLNVALTGNIAAGKSTVAEFFRHWGAVLIDADQLVREVQAPGSPVLNAIVARFGGGVLLPDGSLDRAGLRAIVMADPDARRDLEAIVHPAVEERRNQLVRAAAKRGAQIVINDIPLLFEVLEPGAFDAVVLVDAPDTVRLERLTRERGWNVEEARRALAAQQPSATKRAWRGGPRRAAPLLIDNDGGLAGLEERARAVWEELVALSKSGRT
jgi:dephospho-CoA kinase